MSQQYTVEVTSAEPLHVEVSMLGAQGPPGPGGPDPIGASAGHVWTADGANGADWQPPSGGGGAVDSVNTQTGDVVLGAGDVGADPAGSAAAAQSAAESTAAGALAVHHDPASTDHDDRYTPTSSLAAVATSGAYGDLSGRPTLGSAAATDTGDYATAAQGALADSAVQPGALGTAAPLDVAAAGDAAAGEVVKGDDTRLSDARTPLPHNHDGVYEPAGAVTTHETGHAPADAITAAQHALIDHTGIPGIGGEVWIGPTPPPNNELLWIDTTADATITFTTNGATFTPEIELVPDSTALVVWLDDTDTLLGTGPTPSIDFGTAAARTVRMQIDRPQDVSTVNLGHDNTVDVVNAQDTAGAQYDKAPEAVTGVAGLGALVSLERFLATNTPLGGPLDLTGLSALEFVECYDTNITSITLTGCTSLIRLCIERTPVSVLDLNPVAGNVRDVRSALNGGLALTPLTAPLAACYHLCVRDQTVTGLPTYEQMPVMRQLLINNTGQSGYFQVPPLCEEPQLWENDFTHIDFTGHTAEGYLRAEDNGTVTQVTLDGPPFTLVNLRNNALSSAAVDALLIAFDAWETTRNSTINLLGNAARTTASDAAVAGLESRNWTVLVGATTGGNVSPTASFTRTITDLQVDVDGSGSSDPDGTIASYAWTFGDGGTATGATASHTYASDGTYTITLTVTDNEGATHQVSQQVTVSAGGGGQAQWVDDFERADAVGLANVGNGWTNTFGTHDADIVSGDLSRYGNREYTVLTNPVGGTLPEDYELQVVAPSGSFDQYYGVVVRGTFKVFVRGAQDSIRVGGSLTVAAVGTDLTGVAAAPANWDDGNDHTFTVRVEGTTLTILRDGQVAWTGTPGLPTGTGLGIGIVGEPVDRTNGDARRIYRSITVTEVA